MNIQTSSYENKKYRVELSKSIRAKTDTSEYNLTKEEVAESVIRSLDGAIKNMKNGTRSRPIDELLDELDNYVEEEKKNNGTYWNLWSWRRTWFWKEY